MIPHLERGVPRRGFAAAADVDDAGHEIEVGGDALRAVGVVHVYGESVEKRRSTDFVVSGDDNLQRGFANRCHVY